MAAKEKTLQDLFYETLKDIYFAEKKILTALPKLAKAANSEDLKAAFEKHTEETEGQVERLEQVFELIEKPARGKTCPAILGLVEEGQEVSKEFKNSPALDAGLLAVPTAMCVEIMGSSCCDGDKASLGDEAALRLQDISILARLGKHGRAERPDEPDHLAGVDEIH